MGAHAERGRQDELLSIMGDNPDGQPERSDFPARVRVVRIIVFAQTMGLVVFAAAIWVSQSRGPGPHGNGTYSLLAAALLAGLGTASVAFPYFILRQNLTIARGAWQPPPGVPASAYASDSTKLFAVYLNTTIMGLALVEGAGIYCCVAYLLEGQPYVLLLRRDRRPASDRPLPDGGPPAAPG